MTETYTPTEDDLRSFYVQEAVAATDETDRDEEAAVVGREFDRALARIKADAAREALIRAADFFHDSELVLFRDYHYPKETTDD